MVSDPTSTSVPSDLEPRLSAAFRVSPIGMALVALDGRFIAANATFCAMLGRTEDEMLAMGFPDITHPEDLPTSLDNVRALREGKSDAFRIEKRYRHKDGHEIWCETHVSLVRNEQGQPLNLMAQIQDITRRKRAEQDLQASQRQLVSVMDANPNLIYVSDPATFEMLFVNRVLREAMGEPGNRKCHQYLQGRETPCPFCTNGRIFGEHLGESYEWDLQNDVNGRWYRCHDRAITWPDGRLVRYEVAVDITEHKKADEALQESEERFRRLAENARDIIFRMSLPQGHYEYVSPAAKELSGYPPEEYYENPGLLPKIIPPDWHGYFEKEFAKLLRGEATPVYEFPIVHRSGELRWMNQRNILVRDGDRVVALEGIVTDVTERKRSEDKLVSANLQLQAMWNISTLAGTDLKTLSDAIMDNLARTTRSELGFFGFIDEDESVLTILSWTGEAMKGCLVLDKPTRFPIAEAGVWAEAVRRREPFILNDYQMMHPSKRGLPDGHMPLTRLLAVPFFLGNRMVSLAAVANRREAYGEEDVTQIKGFMAGVQAIIERAQAEEALRESEAWHRIILQTALDGFLVLDQAGRILQANEAAAHMSGYAVEELVGMGIPDLEANETLEETAAHIETVLARGWHRFESRHRRKDGTLMDIEVAVQHVPGAKGKLVCFMRDITAAKLLEEDLRKAKAFLETVLNTIPAPIFVKDADGRFLECNEAMSALVGKPREEIVGRTVMDFLPPERARRYHEADLQAMADGERLQYMEQVPNADGQPLDMILHKVPLPGPNGRCHGLVVVLLDITERKRAEAELLQAQKMESVGRLAGGVAHDFNNMLCVILGEAQLAMEQVDPSLPLYNELEEIQKAAQRSADLTRQLLAFARKQTIAPKVLDLNETISGMIKMLRRLIGEDIDLVWMPGDGLWKVKMDPTQIDQILANLCVNARGAISGLGRIVIETRNAAFDVDSVPAIDGAAAGRYVALAVNDNGSGMDPETMDRIFEPFFTTKGLGTGTGLGLSMVYGIVRQNNGFIKLQSQPGQGTSFRIFFPRHQGETEQAGSERGSTQPPRAQRTILLVEDEVSILQITCRMLQKHGYTIIPAASPQEALDLAKRFPDQIHGLVTDVIMPGMSVREFANRMVALFPALKCLYMSGYTADIIARHGVLDDGVHFIQKPFSAQELLVKLREVFEDKAQE